MAFITAAATIPNVVRVVLFADDGTSMVFITAAATMRRLGDSAD